MSAQKPMKDRMQEAMEYIWKLGYGRVDRIDRKVLKRLIKAGKVKITSHALHGRIRHNYVEAIEPAPKKIEKPDTGGPFAKRRAAMEEAEIHYRGKNLGRPKVVGERRLTRRQKREKAKKDMWAKLSK